MEKLKTYWCNNKEQNLIQILGFLFFLFYGVLTILFYKERVLSFDSAASAFELIQTKSFFTPLGRWGYIISQIIPYLFLKLGASLETILKVYSFNFTIIYYLGFLLITKVLNNQKIGIVYLLTLSLTFRNTFYFVGAIFPQGLALAVILYALLTYSSEQKANLKAWGFYGLSLLLGVSMYYFHPLLIIPIGVVYTFVLIEGKTLKNKRLLLSFFLTITWFALKILTLPKGGYESGQIPSLNIFVEQMPLIFDLPSFNYFIYFFKNELIVVSGIYICCILYIFIKKQLLMGLFFLFAPVLYLILIVVTYYKGEGPNMYEQHYILFGFFVALAIVYILNNEKLSKYIILSLVLILTYSNYRIYNAHSFPTKRLHYISKLVEIGQKHPQKKYIIPSEDYLGLIAWGKWALPIETLLLSSIKGKENGVTIYSPDQEEKPLLNPSNGQLYAAPWQVGLMNTRVLDTNFFMLPEHTPYLVFEKLKRDKHYFYVMIKNDYVWMREIRKKAIEQKITVEQCLRNNAEYMANINHSVTPLEKKNYGNKK